MFAKAIASISIIVLSATLVTAEANARCGGGHGFRAFSAMQNHNYIIKRQQSLASSETAPAGDRCSKGSPAEGGDCRGFEKGRGGQGRQGRSSEAG